MSRTSFFFFFLSVVNDLFHSSRPITGFSFGLKVFWNPCVQFTPYVYSAFIKVFNVLKIHLISQSYFRSCGVLFYFFTFLIRVSSSWSCQQEGVSHKYSCISSSSAILYREIFTWCRNLIVCMVLCLKLRLHCSKLVGFGCN